MKTKQSDEPYRFDIDHATKCAATASTTEQLAAMWAKLSMEWHTPAADRNFARGPSRLPAKPRDHY